MKGFSRLRYLFICLSNLLQFFFIHRKRFLHKDMFPVSQSFYNIVCMCVMPGSNKYRIGFFITQYFRRIFCTILKSILVGYISGGCTAMCSHTSKHAELFQVLQTCSLCERSRPDSASVSFARL